MIINKLEGKWYIIYTNFPMWLKGDKQNPCFTYEVKEDYLIDKVSYTTKGKVRFINGYDTLLSPNHFEWRGKGLTKFLKSRWSIKYINEHYDWALIHFEKTLFTPEGYDIIARSKELDYIQLSEMKHVMEQSNLLALTKLYKGDI